MSATLAEIEEKVAKEYGFESKQEYERLVGDVDFTTPGNCELFRKWKRLDGTKDGLLRIINKGE